MKNLTKNSVANVAKVGVASALIGAGLFLSACGGGDESKVESLIKEKYPNAKILSFDEAKKELGLTNKECLNIKKEGWISAATRFVKMADGQFMVLSVLVDSNGKLSMVDKEYTLDMFKQLKPNCF